MQQCFDLSNKLNEANYKKEKLTNDDMWDMFNWLFSAYSRNDTSYKFIFFKAIIDCMDKKDCLGRISFDILFERLTHLSWNLILKYGLAQKATVNDGRVSSLEKIIKKQDEGSCYEQLFEAERKTICCEVKKCKKYVVGALYSDTNGIMYSFSKKEEWIELNPVVETFIKDNRLVIENLNYYKWAQFYSRVNDIEKEKELLLNFKFKHARKNESIYRTILAEEFEMLEEKEAKRINTLELLMLSEDIKENSEFDNDEVEEELYKDTSHMRLYTNDPIKLVQFLKKEKGLV